MRGATPPEGMICKVTVHYVGEPKGNLNPEDEEGSWDLDCNKLFSELRARKRKMQIIDLQGTSGLSSVLLQNCYSGHEEK